MGKLNYFLILGYSRYDPNSTATDNAYVTQEDAHQASECSIFIMQLAFIRFNNYFILRHNVYVMTLYSVLVFTIIRIRNKGLPS